MVDNRRTERDRVERNRGRELVKELGRKERGPGETKRKEYGFTVVVSFLIIIIC
jgi:hypothetical protein